MACWNTLFDVAVVTLCASLTLQPCGVWQTTSGQVTVDGCATVKALLLANLVPVLHGDCVLDTTKGCNILSGDTIITVRT